MILLVHILFGAAIGHLVKIPAAALILAFLSHYLLDLFPHIEYPIKNKGLIILDFCLGFLTIFTILPNQFIVYLCGFITIVPDGLTVLEKLLPNKILSVHCYFHRKKIHFLKHKKIPIYWRIVTQISFVILSLIILLR